MSTSSPPAHTASPRHAGRYPVTRRVLMIIGGITAFLGLFILFGSEDQSVGLGGDVSWQVDEIDPAWGYGLLSAGLVLLAGGLVLAARSRRLPVSEPDAGSGWRDVAAHAGIFLVVNAFLWAQDIAIGGGLDYAYWITIPWGIGLAAQVISQSRSGRERPAGS
jgi:hypothetical protein